MAQCSKHCISEVAALFAMSHGETKKILEVIENPYVIRDESKAILVEF